MERRILGAVLAGGQSRRFGSDKALAMLDGATLLDRAVATLAALCSEVVVVGRDVAPVPVVPDHPAPGMGPLGGIAGALRHANSGGFDAVLSLPVDAVGFDAAGLSALVPGPSCCSAQPVIGLWPVTVMPVVEAILAGEGRHSLRQLADAAGARLVALPAVTGNINTPADLAACEAGS